MVVDFDTYICPYPIVETFIYLIRKNIVYVKIFIIFQCAISKET